VTRQETTFTRTISRNRTLQTKTPKKEHVGMGFRRNFSRGAKSTFCLSFSVCWRSKCNANGRTQKLSNVMATVTYSVFPI